ncbi:MAG TPA: signal peptidase II [Myxococcota bacterium]|nr:signal peptidase II [Myxococcota bacterium]
MFSVIAAGVVILDQVSKWAAVAGLTQAFAAEGSLGFGEKLSRFLWDRHPARDAAVSVLDDFWHFRYVENPGAAWGFLSGSASALRTPFFLLVSLFAMGFIITYFRRTTPGQGLLRAGLALVFGGAIGNFLDRVRLGYVIDFIDWHWYDKATWPTFNVADAAITVGVLILLLEMFLQKPEDTALAKPAKAGRAG